MGRAGHPLDYVDVMIDYLERKIETNAVTPAVLSSLQKRLDTLSARHANDPKFAATYPHMLELQTLIYGEGGHEAKALLFLKESVRETGSARGLYSRLLRQYIVDHSRHVAATSARTQQSYIESNAIPYQPRKRFFTFGKLKVGLAALVILAVAAGVTLHFVPRVAALPNILMKHSEIAQDKQLYESLTEQYKTCSADIEQRKGTINPNDIVGVDAYNKDAQHCEDVLQQLRHVAEQYNSLMGASIRL